MSATAKRTQRTRSHRLIASHQKRLQRAGLWLSTHDVVSRAARILRDRGFLFDELHASVVIRRVYDTDEQGRELYHRAPKSETPSCVIVGKREGSQRGSNVPVMREFVRAEGASFLAALQDLTSWADNRRAS